MKRNIARIGVLILLILTIAVALLARPVSVEPGVRSDVVGQMNAYIEAVEPQGEPAWPLYREAITEVIGDGGLEGPWADDSIELGKIVRANYPDGLEASSGEWDAPRWIEVRGFVRRFDPVLELMTDAAERSRLGKPYVRVGDVLIGEQDPAARISGFEIMLPEVSGLKTLAWLGVVAMRDAADRGDWDVFVERFRSVVALGEHLRRASFTMESQIGAGMIEDALAEVRCTLLEREVPADAIRRIEASMEIDALVGIPHGLELERLLARSILEDLYGPSGFLAVWLLEDFPNNVLNDRAEPTRGDRLRNIAAYRYPQLGEMRRLVDAHYDRQVEWASSLERESLRTAAEAMPEAPKVDRAFRMMFLVPGRLFAKQAMLERAIAATRAMLRLEAIHAETGEWPADAEAVGSLEDPLTGESLRYERTPDGYRLTAPEAGWIEELTWHDVMTDFTAPREPLAGSEQ